MLVSGRMARAFSKMAEKSSMDALAGRPSRCLKNKKMALKSSMNALAGAVPLPRK
jgi:hypothetical protein